MNTSLAETIIKFGYRSLQGNISMDEEIQSNKHNGNNFDDYIAS